MGEYRPWHPRRKEHDDDYDDEYDDRERDGWSSVLDRRGHSSRKRSRSRDRYRSSRSPRRRDFDRSLSPYRERYRSPPRRRSPRRDSSDENNDSPGRKRRSGSPHGYDQNGPRHNDKPRKTLMVRNICDTVPGTYVDKDQVEAFFRAFGVVKGIRIPLERSTSSPRGYAFVEFETLEEAKSVVEFAKTDNELNFDGRLLSVEFSLSENGGEVVPQDSGLKRQMPRDAPSHHDFEDSSDRPPAASGSSSQGVGDWSCANCSYSNFARRDICHICGLHKAEAGDRNMNHDRSERSFSRHGVRDRRGGGHHNSRGRKTHRGPNAAKFIFDAASGWYYDPETRYYVVDTDSNIFFDGTSQRYLKYDTSINCYVPTEYTPVAKEEKVVGDAALPVTSAEETCKKSANGDYSKVIGDSSTVAATVVSTTECEEQGEIKPTVTKKPANDASAAAGNSAKVQSGPVNFALKKPKSSAGAKGKMGKVLVDLQRWNKRQQEIQQEAEIKASIAGTNDATPSKLSAANSVLVSTPAPPVASTEKRKESFIKKSGDKIICDLCRRGFKSVEIAKKHEEASELHKKNLTERNANKQQQQQQQQYRDRAAERRQMHPEEEPVEPAPLFPAKKMEKTAAKVSSVPGLVPQPVVEEPSGVGANLLMAMGWEEGKGLGLEGSGIPTAIEPTGKLGRAGLGAEEVDSKLALDPADSPRSRSQKMMENRWKSVFRDEEEEDEDRTTKKR